jgi:hypothetical protein
VANAAGQGLDIALGGQPSFSWSAVAASAVSNGIAAGVGGSSPSSKILAGAASAATQVLLSGHGKIQFGQVAADAFGNAIGDSIVGQIYNTPGQTQLSNTQINANGPSLTGPNPLFGGINFATGSGNDSSVDLGLNSPIGALPDVALNTPNIGNGINFTAGGQPAYQAETTQPAVTSTSQVIAQSDAFTADVLNSAQSALTDTPSTLALKNDFGVNPAGGWDEGGGGSFGASTLAVGSTAAAVQRSAGFFSGDTAATLAEAGSIEEGSSMGGLPGLAIGTVVAGGYILSQVLPGVPSGSLQPSVQSSLLIGGSAGGEGDGTVPSTSVLSTGSAEYNGVSSNTSAAANSLVAGPISASPPGFEPGDVPPPIPGYVPTAENGSITYVNPAVQNVGPSDYVTPVATDVAPLTSTTTPADSGVAPLLAVASVNDNPGDLIGIPGATRLNPGEQATAARLLQSPDFTGGSLFESPDASSDFTDANGLTYDALGTPSASAYFNQAQFLASIDSHLLKSNDYTVIDLTGFTQDQINVISQHLASLPPNLQTHPIIRIGF